jgi:hypothetical protein
MTTNFDQTIAAVQDYITEQGFGTTGHVEAFDAHAYVEFDVEGYEHELQALADDISTRFSGVTLDIDMGTEQPVLVGIIH